MVNQVTIAYIPKMVKKKRGVEAINEVALDEDDESEEEPSSVEESSDEALNYADSEDWDDENDSSDGEPECNGRMYSVREKMPVFANKDGSPAIGAYE